MTVDVIFISAGSAINFRSEFESGTKLSSVSNSKILSCKNVQVFEKLAFLRCLVDLQFKCFFHKQSGPKNVQIKINSFLRCLDNLKIKCIFHKQSGSGSGYESPQGKKNPKKLIQNTIVTVKVKAGSEFEEKKMWIHNTDCRAHFYYFFLVFLEKKWKMYSKKHY
jgi:hypothetical protein